MGIDVVVPYAVLGNDLQTRGGFDNVLRGLSRPDQEGVGPLIPEDTGQGFRCGIGSCEHDSAFPGEHLHGLGGKGIAGDHHIEQRRLAVHKISNLIVVFPGLFPARDPYRLPFKKSSPHSGGFSEPSLPRFSPFAAICAKMRFILLLECVSRRTRTFSASPLRNAAKIS